MGMSGHTNTHTHRLFSHYNRSWGHCLQLPFHKFARWQVTVLVNVKAGYTPEVHMVEQTSSRRQWKSFFFLLDTSKMATNFPSVREMIDIYALISMFCGPKGRSEPLSPYEFSVIYHRLSSPMGFLWCDLGAWALGAVRMNSTQCLVWLIWTVACKKMYLRRVRSRNFCRCSVCGKFCWDVVKPEHQERKKTQPTSIFLQILVCAMP